MMTYRPYVRKRPTASSASGLSPPSTPSSVSWGWQGTSSSSSLLSTSGDSRPWQTCTYSTCPLQTSSSLCRSPSGQSIPWSSGQSAWRCAKPWTRFTRSASTAACSSSASSVWIATLPSPKLCLLIATVRRRCLSARCRQRSSGWWRWSSLFQKLCLPRSIITPALLTPATLTRGVSASRRARWFWLSPSRSSSWASVTAALSGPFARLAALNGIKPLRSFFRLWLFSFSARCLITWSCFGTQLSQHKAERRSAATKTICSLPQTSPSAWPSWGAA